MSIIGVDRRGFASAPPTFAASEISPTQHGFFPTDGRFLKQFEKKLPVMRDDTASVDTGRSLGLYVFGEGGVGKTQRISQSAHSSTMLFPKASFFKPRPQRHGHRLSTRIEML